MLLGGDSLECNVVAPSDDEMALVTCPSGLMR